MITYIGKQRKHPLYRILSGFIACTFIFSMVVPPTPVLAQTLPTTVMNLPAPGTMIPLSSGFTPVMVNGITIHPNDPFKFDFLVGRGDDNLQGEAFTDEAQRLIKYFLASLTIPEEELWVNLSPYEQDRIIPDSLSKTEMGRDMLAQDYVLKQLTASLMYPENELGEKFWNRIRAKVQDQYGMNELPVNTFNKVWIVPQDAIVYESESTAVVIDSYLKVMLESDYLALANAKADDVSLGEPSSSAEVIRQVIIPEIEKEVNEGETFANLRQIYNSMILATWYKQNLKESLLGQVYVDQKKVGGIDTVGGDMKDKIYQQYLEAFKVGVYNYIKEEYDPTAQDMVPRKYFAGGISTLKRVNPATQTRVSRAAADQKLQGHVVITTQLRDEGAAASPVIPVKGGTETVRDIEAFETLDSRGNPTLEVHVTLTNGMIGKAKVPSGASTGDLEAHERRDDDKGYFDGKGVFRAIDAVNGEIRDHLLKMKLDPVHPNLQALVDKQMIRLDGSENDNKENLGANAILGVSLALADAIAQAKGLELFESVNDELSRIHLYGEEVEMLLPVPMINVINGGAHADTGVKIQEYMILPEGAQSFSQAMVWSDKIFMQLGDILKRDNLVSTDETKWFGNEKGWQANLARDVHGMDFLKQAIEATGLRSGKGQDVSIALDVAASEFYNTKYRNAYDFDGEARDDEYMIERYAAWVKEFGLSSIEDGLNEKNWDEWVAMTKRIGDQVGLVGDDLLVTNPKLLKKGIEIGAGNTILIKVNQIGTLTETLEAIALARQHGWKYIISHRSGETDDTFIMDLAVAAGGGLIKTGGLAREQRLLGAPIVNERLTKYERGLAIERLMQSRRTSLRYAGATSSPIEVPIKSQNIPDSFALVLSDYGLDIESASVTVLEGDIDPQQVLADPYHEFGIATAISQAYGTIFYAGEGNKGKEIGDGNAVFLSELNFREYTQDNPDIAVVMLAAEGKSDASFTQTVGRIYYEGFEGGYWEPKSEEDLPQAYLKIDDLRSAGAKIRFILSDALENTNAQAQDKMDAWSLFSVIKDPGENPLFIDDHMRIVSTNYNGFAADIHPLDPPEVSFPKIAQAQFAGENGISIEDVDVDSGAFQTFLDDFITDIRFSALGPRDPSQKKSEMKSGDKRHLTLIESAQRLAQVYPGLSFHLPGDGNFAPRLLASVIPNLDGMNGKQTIVTDRGKTAELYMAYIAAVLRKDAGAQMNWMFASEKETSAEVSKATVGNFTDADNKMFRRLRYSEEQQRKIYTVQDADFDGIVVETAVTGASEQGFGPGFAKLMQRISAEEDGRSRANSIVVTNDGVFALHTTFKTADMEQTRQDLRAASPEAKEYLKQEGISSPVTVSEWVEKTLLGEEDLDLPEELRTAEKNKRRYVIGGNHKMNLDADETEQLIRKLAAALRARVNSGKMTSDDLRKADIIVIPPFVALERARNTIKDVVTGGLIREGVIRLGAQNVFYEEKGAFTGEVSAKMLKNAGVEYVIVGHSERRQFFGETNEIVNKKAKAVLRHEMIPIIAIGETLEEREAGNTFKVINTQYRESTRGLTEFDKFVTAYEPVWAIGTGKTATNDQANDVHRFIRALELLENGYDSAARRPIEYGGSMNPKNVEGLIAQDNVDGGLIGGASLDADQYTEIIMKSLEHYFAASSSVASDKTKPSTDTEARSSSPLAQDAFQQGGIDLDADHLNLQVNRDGNGVPLPVSQQPLDIIHINGLVPVILNIAPVNIPLILGSLDETEPLAETESDKALDSVRNEYFDRMVEDEELAAI